MQLYEFGWERFFETGLSTIESEGCIVARVLSEDRNGLRLVTESGEVTATAAGRLYHLAESKADLPVVGDWVAAVVYDGNPPTAIIQGVLPRKSLFVRKGAGNRGEQGIAANVDVAFIVTGLDNNYSIRRIERYLTFVRDAGSEPVVVLSKSDLCDCIGDRISEVASSALGAPVYCVSNHTGEGIDQLRFCLKPHRTYALLGSSGVGKSTIINSFFGSQVQLTGDVREGDGKGRHTTTRRELFFLPDGAMIIDTPGMRELQLWAVDEGIAETFGDIEEIAAGCRFSNCKHEGEPGCLIAEALANGEIDPGRYENYRKMLRELGHFATRYDRAAAAAEKARWKNISKQINRINKSGGKK